MYDRPFRITYSYTGIDGHTADITKIIRGPKGMRGRLVDAIVSVTTTTAGASTTPKVQVGKSGALTQSLNMDAGAVTAPGAVVASATAANFAGADTYSKVNPIMDADTDVYLTLKAATGSGAAGVYDLFVVIDWGI